VLVVFSQLDFAVSCRNCRPTYVDVRVRLSTKLFVDLTAVFRHIALYVNAWNWSFICYKCKKNSSL